jgi:hypothetical protein
MPAKLSLSGHRFGGAGGRIHTGFRCRNPVRHINSVNLDMADTQFFVRSQVAHLPVNPAIDHPDETVSHFVFLWNTCQPPDFKSNRRNGANRTSSLRSWRERPVCRLNARDTLRAVPAGIHLLFAAMDGIAWLRSSAFVLI